MPATRPSTRVEVRLLGPLEVVVDDDVIPLGGLRPRSVLAVLALDVNRVVSVDRLVDAVWGEEAPDRVQSTLQVHVSNLRRALAPAAAALGRDEVIVTRKPGYLLDLPADAHDLKRAEALVAEGRSLAATAPLDALDRFERALALWRGTPLADLVELPFAANVALRLESLRSSVIDDRFELALALGRHAEVLSDLRGAVAEDPTNERRRVLQMLALYRAGRQAEALDAFQDLRRALVEQLGIDPSPELRELESRILAQDPSLAAPRPGGARPGPIELSTMVGSSLVCGSASLVVDGTVVPLTEPVTTIGRRSDCSVVLDDIKASRAHAEVRMAGGDYVLSDRGSTNGTFVNGVRITQHALRDGDEIRVGSSTLTFTHRSS